MFIYCLEVKKSLMSKIIQFWFAAVLFVVSGVSANDVTEEDIKKGSVQMYTQLSHTDNFILIDAINTQYDFMVNIIFFFEDIFKKF